MKYFTFLIAVFLLTSCGGLKIIEKPIAFNNERNQLTLEYLKKRYDLTQETTVITPKIIVLHWTNLPTLKKSFSAFNKIKLPNWRPEIQNASSLNVSAHFLVDRDGTIYRLMPETKMARHVIGLNYSSIGIENVGGTKDAPLTKEQLKANICIVKYLAKKYDIDYLIGHSEYTNFVGHELWLEKDAGYRTQKKDPGNTFLAAVKKATKGCGFKTTPVKK